MTSLAQLEQEISRLNALNKNSAKALDAFADTSNAIALRARQITKDVKPWEVAQENIALTIEEMAKAARCYHPPPSLDAVLARRDRQPGDVVRCIDYLVYASDYLASHAPNEIADAIAIRTERQLDQIVAVSEDLVKSAFIAAVQTSQAVSAPQQGRRIVVHPKALDGVDKVVQRLGDNFNRTDVLQNEVRSILEQRLRSAVEVQFDSTYRDEEQVGRLSTATAAGATGYGGVGEKGSENVGGGGGGGGSAADGGAAAAVRAVSSAVVRHYQRGAHPLLGISAVSREMVQEVMRYVEQYILLPLDDDYAVAELPGSVAMVVFDRILARMARAIYFGPTLLQDVTKAFVDARGQDASMVLDGRYYRDVIFIGLNLVEEMWAWKELANALPGDARNFVDYVENEMDGFLYKVRLLLDGYVNAKGGLEKGRLVDYACHTRRMEWLPGRDCTVHEAAANVLYLHKTLLTSYYGALKLVLCGNAFDPNADEAALQEVEDFLVRGVLGTVQDLQTIAQATVELQREGATHGRHRRLRAGTMLVLHGATAGSARDDKSSGVGGEDGREVPCLSPEVFVLNNLLYLQDNYRREPCFAQRLMPLDVDQSTVPAGAGRAHRSTSVPVVPIVTHVLSLLEEEKERCIDDYGASWAQCFSDLAVVLVADTGAALSKSQRMAVKQWHGQVSVALQEKIRDGMSQTVMDPTLRSRLITGAVHVVQEHFARAATVLQGRVWSRRPQRWMPYTVDQWVELMRRML